LGTINSSNEVTNISENQEHQTLPDQNNQRVIVSISSLLNKANTNKLPMSNQTPIIEKKASLTSKKEDTNNDNNNPRSKETMLYRQTADKERIQG
jgi:hypothetical protein